MRDTKITHKQNRKTKIRKLVELLAGNLLFRIARSELGTVSTENKKFVAPIEVFSLTLALQRNLSVLHVMRRKLK
tara:strand:+ start:984 stop:1208 length:225 start_codon:yes stop_codon:yes gene_type:complete